MAVFQEQGSEGCSFTVRPNCAMSWRATKFLVLFFACCFAAVGAYFASIGAWLVLPFAGLELAVLAVGFYISALAGHSREVIEIHGPVVRVMRGGRKMDEVARFPANWTQVLMWRDPTGWYPCRLQLRCHGRRLEIASQVVEAEREELALALEDWLGFAFSRGGDVNTDIRGSGRESPARQPPTGRSARAFFHDGTPSGADERVPASEQRGKVGEKRVLRKI